jgi:hypothetical protein
MTYFPVTSDVQVLELAYAINPSLSEQCLSFSDCTDISLGLIETNGLKAVLSAQASLTRLENTIITLRKIGLEHLEADKVLVRLEPLQQLHLCFELGKAILDEMPLMLPETTLHDSLVQHLILGRLEHVLTEMDTFYLHISAEINEAFANLLHLRGYQYNQGVLSKYLLMTNTVEVLP